MSTENSAALLAAIREMGVVGAGGAGFPTHLKLAASCDTVIANGVECEPLLYGDRHLLGTETEAVIGGLELAMRAAGAQRGILAVKKKEAGLLEKAVAGKEGLRVVQVEDFYPAGDEQVLVYETTGRIVPPGCLPLSVGVVVQNVQTLRNVFQSVRQRRPVIRRLLSCAGEVVRPSIVEAHLGASLRHVIELCGGATVEEPALLVGGPMMGFVTTDLDTPVTKLTGGIVVLAREHALVQRRTRRLEVILRQGRAACCQCSYCTELCPRYLLGQELNPHRIMRQVALGLDLPSSVIRNALLCSECGLCEDYACAMELSPRRVNAALKQRLAQGGLVPAASPGGGGAREAREARKVPAARLLDRLQLQRYARPLGREVLRTQPQRVELLLQQHSGQAALPVVREGERVLEGQLIAEAPSVQAGARLHASIGGKVIVSDAERIILCGT